jgi:VanZ like protein/concanavalin A-like lectin/glucanase superfamily protein
MATFGYSSRVPQPQLDRRETALNGETQTGTGGSIRAFEPANRKLKVALALTCLLVLGATLSAGLWPFSFHIENQARWRPEKQGLAFADTGMVVSEGTFSGLPSVPNLGCSIEMWVEPSLSFDSSTLLAFYDPRARSRIELLQRGNDFVFRRDRQPDLNESNRESVLVKDVLQKDRRTLITLSSAAAGGLDVYIDGMLRASSKSLQLLPSDFAGTLEVANTPYQNASFYGIVGGLAFYDRALPAQEVLGSYRAWTTDRSLLAGMKPDSLYLFDEKAGRVVHNSGRTGPDLAIPENYFIFEREFLVPFWREFRGDWQYGKSLAINALGLVPLGVFFAALFAWLFGPKRSLLYAAFFGFCVSFTIELLQAFIPTRVSGTTDIITNTLGTALGAWFYLGLCAQGWLKRLVVVRTRCSG